MTPSYTIQGAPAARAADRPCPACATSGPHALHAVAVREGVAWDLFRCAACEARFYHPAPGLEDLQLGASEDGVRLYAEQNVNLWVYAAHLGPLLAARPPGRMLDIGCNFGFALDFARRVFGWQVHGVEPSDYGQHGAAALDLPILQGLLTENDPFEGALFDLIHASQVIEHVPDPAAFLALLRRYLAPGGVIALTTPCADAIDTAPIDPLMRDALLSPGSHTVLFNARAMDSLLQAAGFGHRQVDTTLNQVCAFASDTAFILVEAEPYVLTRRYLEAAAAGLPEGMLRRAMRGRLYRMLVETAALQDAAAIWPSLDFPPPADDLDRITDISAFLRRYPANAAVLAYFRGIELLNQRSVLPGRNGEAAARMFAWAEALCLCRLRLPASDGTEEANLIWPARFHHALANLIAGAHGTALSLAEAVIQADAADPGLRTRAAEVADLARGYLGVPGVKRPSLSRRLYHRLRRLVAR